MNQKQKEETIEVFAEAFHEVIVPVLEDLATKKDLEGLATKKDLEGFATKRDLEGFATKKDLEELATKADLAEVKEDVAGVKADLAEVKQQLNTLDDRVERISRSLILITDHQADKLDDHEKRIGKIEASTNN